VGENDGESSGMIYFESLTRVMARKLEEKRVQKTLFL